MTAAPPPVWIQWGAVISVIIAGLGLIFQTIVFFKDRSDRQKDITRSKLDEYWLRQVIFPACVEPLIELGNHTIKLISEAWKTPDQLSEKEKRRLISDLTNRKLAIVYRSNLFSIIEDSLSESFAESLDDLEDMFSTHIGLVGTDKANWSPEENIAADKNYIQQFVWINVRDILNEIIAQHRYI